MFGFTRKFTRLVHGRITSLQGGLTSGLGMSCHRLRSRLYQFSGFSSNCFLGNYFLGNYFLSNRFLGNCFSGDRRRRIGPLLDQICILFWFFWGWLWRQLSNPFFQPGLLLFAGGLDAFHDRLSPNRLGFGRFSTFCLSCLSRRPSLHHGLARSLLARWRDIVAVLPLNHFETARLLQHPNRLIGFQNRNIWRFPAVTAIRLAGKAHINRLSRKQTASAIGGHGFELQLVLTRFQQPVKQDHPLTALIDIGCGNGLPIGNNVDLPVRLGFTRCHSLTRAVKAHDIEGWPPTTWHRGLRRWGLGLRYPCHFHWFCVLFWLCIAGIRRRSRGGRRNRCALTLELAIRIAIDLGCGTYILFSIKSEILHLRHQSLLFCCLVTSTITTMHSKTK